MLIIDKILNFQEKFKLKEKNIIIVSSVSIIKKNIIKKFIKSISNNNYLRFYSNVKPGAYLKDLNKLLKYKTPDIIIAIGGGSVIDISKAFSCLKLNTEKELELKKINKIKLIVIPTISGSGAESSKGAILKTESNKKIAYRSTHLIPDHVILDFALLQTAPKKLRCECLFDCLSHAIETYLSKKSLNKTKKTSVKCIKDLLKINYKNIDHIKNQKIISINSFKMGINLAKSTTCLPHRIQYSLSKHTNMTHAQSIIALYKGWLEIVSKTEKFKQLEKKVTLNKNLKDQIKKLKKNLYLKHNLKKLKLDKKKINLITKNTKGTLSLDPCFQSKQTIKKIIELSL